MRDKCCSNCVHLNIDGYCNYWEMEVNPSEWCSNHIEEDNEISKMTWMAVLAIAIMIISMWYLTSCSPSDQVKTENKPEHMTLVVSDVPYVNKQEEEAVVDPEPAHEPEQDQQPEPITKYIDEVTYVHEGTLTMEAGVNSYNGKTETLYSSNVLYHYMTPQWHTDSNGVWCDEDGYVIISSSELPYGSTHETSLGMGKVYDSGCAEGVVDIYVSW